MRFPPDIDWGLTLPKIPLCALLAGNGHTVQTTIFDREKSERRKLERPKSLQFRRFLLEKSTKSRKFKKSKKSNNRKLSDFLIFWLFAKSFTRKVTNRLGFSRCWSTGSMHADVFFAVLLLFFGCFFVLFLGARNANLQLPRQDHIAYTMLWIPPVLWVLKGWILETHKWLVCTIPIYGI